MAREEDGRNEKRAFFSLALPSLTRRILSCFCLLARSCLGFPSTRVCNWKCGGTRPEVPWVPSPALSLPGPYGPLCLPWVRRPLGSPTCLTARLALQQPGGQRPLFFLSGGSSLFSPLSSHGCRPSAGHHKEAPAPLGGSMMVPVCYLFTAQTRTLAETSAASTLLYHQMPRPLHFLHCESPS